MPCLRAFSVPVLIALMGLALPAWAAPIVFDFEDGLQGWELHGSAQRVQTQLLGGEWAIFGNGFMGEDATFISREIDLTNIGSASFQFFTYLDILFGFGEIINPSTSVFSLFGCLGISILLEHTFCRRTNILPSKKHERLHRQHHLPRCARARDRSSARSRTGRVGCSPPPAALMKAVASQLPRARPETLQNRANEIQARLSAVDSTT
jgi:hypothetical protein